VNPKVIVLLAGINNVGNETGDSEKVADITQGMKAIVDVCKKKAPKAILIITAIFPRNDNLAAIPTINQINRNILQLADGNKVRYLDINDKLADKEGRLFPGIMNADKLHPTLKAYQVWADALKPIFTEILGPPAKTDHAPPPTGDPSAKANLP
jgi:(4-O-methyl)-D-glucuronate---lignin esterase